MKRRRSDAEPSRDEERSSRSCTLDVASQCCLCPPSLRDANEMRRKQLSITCGAVFSVGCAAGFSLSGAITFPLFPLPMTPSVPGPTPGVRRWCCASDTSSPTLAFFGLVIFRTAAPPFFHPDASQISNRLPQMLRTQTSPCLELATTERLFDLVWVDGSTVVASIPCEERLLIVRGIRLDDLSVAPSVGYFSLPTGTVPLALATAHCDCGHRVFVSTLHDGVFVFSVYNNGVAAVELRHHLPPMTTRNPFCPTTRLVAFRLGAGMGAVNVPRMKWLDACIAEVGPYDEKVMIFHVASGRRVDLEHNREFAPLAMSSAHESIVLCQSLGSVDHVAVVDRGGLDLQRCWSQGGDLCMEQPIALSNVATMAKSASFRRDIMCAVTLGGWVGLLHRCSRSMSGWRWLHGQQCPALADLGPMFVWLLLQPPDEARPKRCPDETHSAAFLSRRGVFTIVRFNL